MAHLDDLGFFLARMSQNSGLRKWQNTVPETFGVTVNGTSYKLKNLNFNQNFYMDAF